MIRVQNIYYMLAYAYRALQADRYKKLATESFENIADLCSAILIMGISKQLKKGLGQEFVSTVDSLSTLRGKIEIGDSLKDLTFLNGRMVCLYDEFSADTKMNRVLKATMKMLILADISAQNRRHLRKILVFFDAVGPIDLKTVDWRFHFDRNNQTYRMLMGICQLVVQGLLQTQSDGSTKLMGFFDEQHMSRLYEKFLLEYFRKEHPDLKVGASHIAWQLDGEPDCMLPEMKSDIMLSSGNRILIIDAKYYSQNTQFNYGVRKIHSGNLYQIFTYVKNKEAELSDVNHEVAGMLLYAKTDALIQPNSIYQMSGNRISVQTLDLDCDFAQVREQLDGIAADFFGL